MINRLEVAWANWRALSKAERAQFLILFSEAHCPAAAGGAGQRRRAGRAGIEPHRTDGDRCER